LFYIVVSDIVIFISNTVPVYDELISAIDNDDGLLLLSVLLIIQLKLPLNLTGFTIFVILIDNNPFKFSVMVDDVIFTEYEIKEESFFKLLIVVFSNKMISIGSLILKRRFNEELILPDYVILIAVGLKNVVFVLIIVKDWLLAVILIVVIPLPIL